MAGSIGTTVLDLVTEALSILGVYSQGENLDAADLASAMFTLAALIDGYGAEKLKRFQITPATFATSALQASYVLGPGSVDWATATLPADIDSAGYYTDPTQTLELPIRIVDRPEYDRNALKTLSSSFLAQMLFERGAASHTLTFYPVPTLALNVVLYLAQAIAQFTAPSNVVSLPFGYQELLTYELALKVAAKFGANIPQYLPDAWRDAREKVMARNFIAQHRDARIDPALTGGRGGDALLRFYEGK
jgi:hypothetical protein